MELLLFTESQNLRLWGKYGASKFEGITQSHTKYRGGKMTKNDHFRSIFSKLLVSYCPNLPKIRFYQVLHVSVSFMCRNVQILKTWAENGQKSPFFTNQKSNIRHFERKTAISRKKFKNLLPTFFRPYRSAYLVKTSCFLLLFWRRRSF